MQAGRISGARRACQQRLPHGPHEDVSRKIWVWLLHCYALKGRLQAGPNFRQRGSTVASTFTAQLEFSFREAVKLLVVDDDADTRQMLSVYFSGQEYSVATASSGKEALDAMKRNGHFDLVLLDLVTS
ncbi:MAG: hypothetical protein DMG16_23275 [Acidobacteria bacterium]|nr:MAG: hypothetical protein DMG16_23275 [Acidobacteriota bacterium]